MKENITKEQLVQWLNENRTHRVVDALVYGVRQSQDKEMRTAILSQSSQWNNWLKIKALGVQSHAELTAQYNTIHNNLLHWVEQLKEEYPLNIPTELLQEADEKDRLHVLNRHWWTRFNWKEHKPLVTFITALMIVTTVLISYFYVLPYVYFQKATTAWQLDKYQESLMYCDKVIDINPRSSEAYNLKASSLLYLSRFQEGIKEANTALNLDINNPYPYSTLAQIYAELGNSAKFYEFLGDAIRRKFDLVKHQNEIGFLRYSQEKDFLILLKSAPTSN
jgi:tetratricopeptide (TPR) repeat protein